MNGVPLAAYLALGLFMFATGVVGVIIRRNPIVIFMCIELMLNAVNLTFLAFAKYQISNVGAADSLAAQRSVVAGQMMVVFVMAVAAAEVAVGLGIIMSIFRLRENVDIDELNLLRG
ncbi:NADH-quinone oxidoreductase subunit NuoK [Fimbriimonas ginsengisoli]|uniref:NADH-quinone oxidoreductase subunit K n=1 Tax=Fimbriimonas ginsengisoli Gsoil 348 TaxID=661478 RepID=A0A068NKT8_FIMGI|nr:NADH-quinone oxidoreductase subunit NuoK [Fimbriimonas ginsengisoli]AIE84076.1 putative NADH dehydrogenase I subunit K [Fimbriimonas ginsengisoli Gsoil 348]